MARIRTIKPSFWADDKVASLNWEERLLLVGLISFADDAGRFVATTSAISGYVFPLDEVPTAKLKRMLAAIAKTGIVSIYTVNGRQYGYLPRWRKHQVISKPQRSQLPEPPPEGLWSE